MRLLAVCCLLGGCTLTASAENWPAWRGPTGQGRSTEKNLPTTWSPTQNVKWKIPLPDAGNSTPIIWGDRVFLTQATEKGTKRSLWCLDRRDGSKLWEKTVTFLAKEPTHATNPYCSASPVTDGQVVVVSHGSAGVYCYNFAGQELWHRDFGPCHHIWGNAASPVIVGDTVIQNFGPGEQTFLVALKKSDGSERWRIDIPGGQDGRDRSKGWLGSWSTPVLAEWNGRTEVILSWPGVVRGYDPATGQALWSCSGLDKNPTDQLTYTSPLVSERVIVAMAGFGGPAIALRRGGSGDITATHRLWRVTRNPQRIGSGVIIGNHVYTANEPGLACLELQTGKTVWEERVNGGIWGSIVHADGRLYVVSQTGETVVFAPNPNEFELLARNSIGSETTRSSLAVAHGEFFLRTYQHLWCIAEPK